MYVDVRLCDLPFGWSCGHNGLGYADNTANKDTADGQTKQPKIWPQIDTERNYFDFTSDMVI